MTVDELLAQARAIPPHRRAPAEALHARARGALLVDISGDDQRREDGPIPGAIVLPATPWNGAATPLRSGGILPLPAGTCASSSSVTRDTNSALLFGRCHGGRVVPRYHALYGCAVQNAGRAIHGRPCLVPPAGWPDVLFLPLCHRTCL
jgi:hypothetical protein